MDMTNFKITVIDEQTDRGVPLVELRTTNGVRNYTDSNGVIAFFEPDLMGQEVFFHVRSHGYKFTKKLTRVKDRLLAEVFGEDGTVIYVKSGGSSIIKIKRLNIAERLYRITGAGIYRDSIMFNRSAPIKKPLLNSQVVCQDTVIVITDQNKLSLFWDNN